MARSRVVLVPLVVGAASLAAGAVLAAGNIEIAPTTIEFPSNKNRVVFYATNRGDDPVAVQIEGLEWTQTGNTDQLTESHALAVSPPMARILPGQRQIIRLALDGVTAAADEASYRLVVSEIPDGSAPPTPGMRVMLKFSLPVFRASAGSKPYAIEWTATRRGDDVDIAAHNSGARHAKLINLTVMSANGKSMPLDRTPISYLLPGATRVWSEKLPSAEVASAGIRVVGREESSGARIDATVAVRQ